MGSSGLCKIWKQQDYKSIKAHGSSATLHNVKARKEISSESQGRERQYGPTSQATYLRNPMLNKATVDCEDEKGK